MPETAVEKKAICEKCGVDVRENTMFCYNCGHSFTEAAAETNGTESAGISDEAQTALDDLAARLRIDESESVDRVKLASAERKRARVAPKRPKEEVWEGTEGRSVGALFVISLVIFLLVAAVVFLTVYWK